MDQVERTARLIRSKGVGIYFVTQAPTDVPSSVLAQLGNRVQHALRAFTPDDADALRKTARTFPMTDFYDVEKTITSLGTGEALVTVLSPRGVPTPLAATRLLAPDSLMAPIPPRPFSAAVAASPFAAKYGATVDRESAYEMINAGSPRRGPRGGGRGRDARGRRPDDRDRDEHDDAGPAAARDRPPGQRSSPRPRRPPNASARRRRRPRREADRARQRSIDSAIRTGGKVVTSRAGQDLIRGIFGTLFGGGKSK